MKILGGVAPPGASVVRLGLVVVAVVVGAGLVRNVTAVLEDAFYGHAAITTPTR